MKLKQTSLFFGASLLFTSLLFSPVKAVTLYSIQDLGELTLDLSVYDQQNLKLRLNNNNEVVGWERKSKTSNADFTGFIWNLANGKSYPLAGSTSYKLTDVNDSSQTVGHVYDLTGGTQTTIWNSDFSSSTVISGRSNSALGININNEIAGSRVDVSGILQAFTASSSGSKDITSTATDSNEASAINNSGFITGKTAVNGADQAFIWDDSLSTLTTLNTINPMIVYSWGSDINNNSQVVGGFKTGAPQANIRGGNFQNEAFVWDLTNGFTPLTINKNNIAWATAINNTSLIVGGALLTNQTGGGINRSAILWDNGTPYELNTITSNIGNWRLRDATDVNDDGFVVGIGQINSVYHAFLLSPTPNTMPAADLSLNAIVINPPVKKGKSDITLTVESNQSLGFKVSNLGPDSANNVKISFTSPIVAIVDKLVYPKGTCTIDKGNNTIDCDIDELVKDESAVFAFQITNDSDQSFDIEGNVISDQLDPPTEVQNSFREKVKMTADAVVIVPPTPQNPDTTDPSIETPTQTAPSTTPNKPAQASSSKSGGSGWGCAIGTSAMFDPMFFVLLMLSLYGIARNRKANFHQ